MELAQGREATDGGRSEAQRGVRRGRDVAGAAGRAGLLATRPVGSAYDAERGPDAGGRGRGAHRPENPTFHDLQHLGPPVDLARQRLGLQRHGRHLDIVLGQRLPRQ